MKDNKVLLWKRKWAHWQWTWQFPWGHLEFMENLEECAKREVLEETNLEIKNVSFVTITNDFFTEDNKHYITIFMKSTYDSWDLKNMEPHKCESWEWFDWNNLPYPLMIPINNFLKQNINPLNIW